MDLNKSINLLLERTARHFLCEDRLRLVAELEKLHSIEDAMIHELTQWLVDKKSDTVYFGIVKKKYKHLIHRVIDSQRMYVADEINEYASSSRNVRDKAISKLRAFVEGLVS